MTQTEVGPTPWSNYRTQKRNHYCYFRSDCLNLAAAQHWPGFTCEFCSLLEVKADFPEPIIQSPDFTGVYPNPKKGDSYDVSN